MIESPIILLDEMQTLQQTPTSDQIQSSLQTYLQQQRNLPLSTDIKFITTLLKYTIPIHKQLPALIRTQLRLCFLTVRSISNLVNQVKVSKEKTYLDFVKFILTNDQLLVKLVQNSNNLAFDLRQIGVLLFGGRIFNLFEGQWDVRSYANLMVSQLIQFQNQKKEEEEVVTKVAGDWILKLLYLHPLECTGVYFKELLRNEQNRKYLQKLFVKDLNQTQMIQLLTKFFFPFFVEKYLNQSNVSTFIKILQLWKLNDEVIGYLTKAVQESSNEILQQLVIYIMDNSKTKHLEQLLRTWSDKQFIDLTSIQKICNITKMLILLTEKINPVDRKQISQSSLFLNGVTYYLEKNDLELRNFTMMFVVLMTDGAVDYKVPNDDDRYQISRITFEKSDDLEIDYQSIFEDLHNVSTAVKETYRTNETDSDDNDSDDEDTDDEDDGGIPGQRDPVFLKDLILRLNGDNVQSYTDLLRITIKLVRKKVSFLQEIRFHSQELLTLLVALTNKYDEDEFEKLKINAIISVLVTNPKSVNIVLNLFFEGDYSLQQRMMILSSIGLSARELSGIQEEDNDVVMNDYDTSFPTEQIPSRRAKLVEDVSEPKIQEIHNDQINNGTIVRKSTKLTKPVQNKKKKNNFAPIAHQWFYPLANALTGTVNMGSFTDIFMKNYLTTLRLILGSAWPCAGWEDMKDVLEEIMVSYGEYLS